MNQAEKYGVTIQPTANTPAWKVISVRRLSASENGSKRNVFVDVLTATGERDRDPDLRIGWSWEGQRQDEQAPPVPLDKPDAGELGHGNIPIDRFQKVAVWIVGGVPFSDVVSGMHTNHPDEAPGNTWGHFSYKVVFKRADDATVDPGLPIDGEVARLKAAIGRAIAELQAAL